MSKRIIFYLLGGIAAVGLIWFGISRLNKGKSGKEYSPQLANYVSAYTSGVVSKSANVKVRLTAGFVEQIGDERNIKNIFSFKPSINGQTVWEDDYTLVFKPDDMLPSGKQIRATLKLEQLGKVEDGMAEFIFDFKTINQQFEVAVDEIITTDNKTLKWQKTIGKVIAADIIAVDELENLLTVKLDGNKMPVKWLSQSTEKVHYFEIDSIERKKVASEMQIQWDGNDIDVKSKGSLNVQIPAIGDFKLISTRVVHQPEQYFHLQFSDPISKKQSLDGLISIDGVSRPKFVIDGNVVKVYPPERLDGQYQIRINAGIRNVLNYAFKENKQISMTFERIKPAIRLVNSGIILPDSEQGLIFPFEAVSLNAIDVTIVRIYENNITQFLQINDMGGDYELRRVGMPVLRKTISLLNADVLDFGQWNRFTLDLNELINAEKGAIYHIKLNFRQHQSTYSCVDVVESETEDVVAEDYDWSAADGESSNWDYYSESNYYGYYYYDNYWENRDNPCHPAYYQQDHSVSQNIFASNIGLIAKMGRNNTMQVIATDILSANPLPNINIKIYNYQSQIIAEAVTDSDGFAGFDKVESAHLAVAQRSDEFGYLKFQDGNSLSVSRFDVNGLAVKEGLKGYFYGERGVWRPGDSIFLTFVLKENKPVPAGQPLVFEVTNPSNQSIYKTTHAKNNSNFYTFRFATSSNAPTGNYVAKLQVGGTEFSKYLMVETVKPNRLKIKIDFGDKELTADKPVKGDMKVNWLHGAVAENLNAIVEYQLSEMPVGFENYKDFEFNDVTKYYYADNQQLFTGKLNDAGEVEFSKQIKVNERAPGKLKATFTTRVFEKSGNFSIDQFSLPYYPYNSFVGIKTPPGDKARGMLLTDTTHQVDVIIVDKEGKNISENHDIEFALYKLEWRWWWDKSHSDLINYTTRYNVEALQTEVVKTRNGKAKWNIRIAYPEWGRYLVRAVDTQTGYSATKVVYIDWPGWAGRARKDQPGGASMLAFTSDKAKYEVGETAVLTIPSNENSRALISIENGTGIVNAKWLNTNEGETKYAFKITKDMVPNVYVNVSLLQPHSQTVNDLPIRLYGIVPLTIEDPATVLKPVIDMPNELESEKAFDVIVSEAGKQEMTYTLAIVDEGLLDLTRFGTPNPHNHFFAKEALGVKSWDIFNSVIGAYGGQLERLLAVGGGDEMGDKTKNEANRFRPVVRFYGPFTLKKGKKQSHTITLPQYIGSVRTMVVAGNGNAYGMAEKATPVRKPLMVLATLPRVLGPGEQAKLPVEVFAMKDDVKEVTVKLESNPYFKVVGDATKTVRFSKPGEKYVVFDVEIAQQVGVGQIAILASSGKYSARQDIEIDVRNPNPRITEVIEQVVEKGANWQTDFKPIGIAGTNNAVLEVSGLPPLNLEKRLKYLINYPHGCVEQTTSAVFPQLLVSNILELNQEQTAETEKNIKDGIKQLAAFQLSNGGLGYWPNSNSVSEWGTSYAGHFMVLAEKKGYDIPSGFIKKWRKYQQNEAKRWSGSGQSEQMMQAYRLYTLALEGHPQNSAMNRMYEMEDLTPVAKWRLAAAFHLAGKKQAAKELIVRLSTEVTDYNELSGTFGSALRDKAMILETLTLLDEKSQAFKVFKQISDEMSTNKWLSTQTTAYALIAASAYADAIGSDAEIKFAYKLNNQGNKQVASSAKIVQMPIDLNTASDFNLQFTNNSGAILYARVIMDGIPANEQVVGAENSMQITVNYTNSEGQSIDPATLRQGTDFVAEVTIKNPGTLGDYKEIALSQIFPSGWEIINTRMYGADSHESGSPSYRDFRDDRVFTYFDLNRNQQKTFKVMLTAAYSGKYYLPPVYAETMYDASINARVKGNWVTVTDQITTN